MQATMTVECPKCRVVMRHIERNGVTIELCPECGGMFLDRGELEHLTQAEQAYNARGFDRETIPTSGGKERREGLLGRFGDDDDDDVFDSQDRRRGQHGDYVDDDHPHGERGGQGGRRKRRGFLSDFLDFG